jgi:hypothetical protein
MTNDKPDDWGEPPLELARLDARLARLEFAPRASLAPEIAGSAQRPAPAAPRAARGRRWLTTGIAAAAAIVAAVVANGGSDLPAPTVVDHCCADLDGGGIADDGIRVVVGQRGRVKGVAVYEDRDGSHGLTATDTVRYRGSGDRRLPAHVPPGSQAVQHCCADYDGGGAPDDGLLVLEIPPDRVLMAVVYEERPPAATAH